jgi:hypothetical protein
MARLAKCAARPTATRRAHAQLQHDELVGTASTPLRAPINAAFCAVRARGWCPLRTGQIACAWRLACGCVAVTRGVAPIQTHIQCGAATRERASRASGEPSERELEYMYSARPCLRAKF